MKPFYAFFKKELLEILRSGKLLLLLLLFFLFGIMNPAIAKLTPWLFELFSDSLAESGMTVTAVTVDAMTSWTQFYKNIPMALIVFILLYSGIFTREYDSGTLLLVLTKGLSRYKAVLAKAAVLLLLWTGGYLLCFAVTYGYNAYFWDNSVASSLLRSALHWWLFGVYTLCFTVLFSTMAKSHSTVLLGTGASVLLPYLLGLFPKVGSYVPTALMNTASLLIGAESASDYTPACLITGGLSLLALLLSIPLMNRKQL